MILRDPLRRLALGAGIVLIATDVAEVYWPEARLLHRIASLIGICACIALLYRRRAGGLGLNRYGPDR
jgi:hypothetical protein